MKKIFKNLNEPTPAKWVKIGVTLSSISAFIAGYGITNDIKWLSITGVIAGVLGIIITNLTKEDGENNTEGSIVPKQKRKSSGRPRKN